MKKIFYLLMTAFAVLCVCSSCSKDDEGAEAKKSYQELIVGTWQLDKEYVAGQGLESEDKTIANFKSDGRVFMSYDDGSSGVANWSIDGSKLYIDFEGEREVYTIKKLDSTEMILTWFDDGVEVTSYFIPVK